MSTEFCPTCHQPVPHVMRLGIALTRLKARIFDIISLSGESGISSKDIYDKVWEGNVNGSTVKSHVNQINDRLVETNWRIVPTNPRGGYRLVKISQKIKI